MNSRQVDIDDVLANFSFGEMYRQIRESVNFTDVHPYDMEDFHSRLHDKQDVLQAQEKARKQARMSLGRSDDTTAYCDPAIVPRLVANAPEAAGAAPPSDSASFPKFAMLPVEIRLKIWEYALPGPTLIKRDIRVAHRFVGGPARRPIPAVLQACSESRRAFVASPGSSDRNGSKYQLVDLNGDGRRIYVDWSKDDICIFRYFSPNTELEFIDLSKIRFLTLYMDPARSCLRYYQFYGLKELTPLLTSLELLTIAVMASSRGWVTLPDEDFIENGPGGTWEATWKVPVFWEQHEVESIVEEGFRHHRYTYLSDEIWDPPKWRVILVE